MSLTTYAGLQQAVSDTLHRADLASYIPDWIVLAESRINKHLRVRAMESTVATVMAAGVIPTPTNYMALKDAYISSTSPYVNLERKTASWIYDKYPNRVADDVPKYIAREGSNFIFGPYPNANFTVTQVYWARLSPLSSATNGLFTTWPGLWLFGALCESAPWLKADTRIPIWEAKFKDLIVSAQDEEDDEFSSGSTMQMVAG